MQIWLVFHDFWNLRLHPMSLFSTSGRNDDNSFDLPHSWTFSGSNMRWHVICALAQDVLAKNPQIEVLRVVEIGVFDATTSLFLLNKCRLRKPGSAQDIPLQLHLIDPYTEGSREFEKMREAYARESSVTEVYRKV